MRAQSAVHVGTKIDREQSSAGPGRWRLVAAVGGAAVLVSAVACDAVRVGTYTSRIFVHCVCSVSFNGRHLTDTECHDQRAHSSPTDTCPYRASDESNLNLPGHVI